MTNIRKRDSHSEDFCGRCGGANPSWHAASPLWNAVMRTRDREPFDGIVCPNCFAELARRAGVTRYICVTTHHPDITLATTFGDGQVWDPIKCMWVDPV